MKRILLIIGIVAFFSVPLFAQHLDTAWVRIYNGPDDNWDVLEAIVTDDSGRIYITGSSYGDCATIKYYPNGDTAWLRTYDIGDADRAQAIAVDDSGNVVVTGYGGNHSYENYLTIKYDSSGSQRWVESYNGPGSSEDKVEAIAIDDSYNICVTGYSYGSGTGADFATIKYYPNGDTAWLRRYNGPGNSTDHAYDIAVDDSGYVYVTGSSTGNTTYQDLTTIKYTSDGDTVWLRRYNGSGNSTDLAYAIALDGSYNVYVTGYSYGSGTGADFATIKYYQNGDTAWVRTYDGPGSSTDLAFDIAVDNSGNVCVAGYSTVVADEDEDFTTIKYDSDGDTAWVRTYDGTGDGYMDRAHAVAVDDSGNVYVTGMSVGDGSNHDVTTIRYNPEGATAWIRTFDGAASGNDQGKAIAVGHYENPYWNIYVGGLTVGSNSSDYTTIRYAQFKCGDVNCTGNVSVSDVVYLSAYLYSGGPPPCPILKSGDVNCDEGVGAGDQVYLINYLFKSGPPPCDPDTNSVPDCYGF